MMRLALLALVLMMAGCAAPAPSNPPPDSYTDHAGWTEYYPSWFTGPAALRYHDRELRISDNESYATDGSTFLYVTPSGARDPATGSICRSGERHETGIWVLLVADGCVWAHHPGVACDRSAVCDTVR